TPVNIAHGRTITEFISERTHHLHRNRLATRSPAADGRAGTHLRGRGRSGAVAGLDSEPPARHPARLRTGPGELSEGQPLDIPGGGAKTRLRAAAESETRCRRRLFLAAPVGRFR